MKDTHAAERKDDCKDAKPCVSISEREVGDTIAESQDAKPYVSPLPHKKSHPEKECKDAKPCVSTPTHEKSHSRAERKDAKPCVSTSVKEQKQASAPMIIPSSDRLGSTKEYYFSRKLREIAQLREQGHQVINLGIGSPDLPPPAAAIEQMIGTVQRDDAHAYQSYSGRPELRQAIAKWYNRYFGVSLDPANEVLPLIGSKEGIMHISMAFLNPGDEVLVPDPGYPTYRAAGELAGAHVRSYQLSDERSWLPDLDALSKTDLSKVKIMWVNYPHMPTGAQASLEWFIELVDWAREHSILLVNDNPYAFILTERPLSLLSVPSAKDVALELNSLSKSHNLAGWRVGMLLGRADLVQTVLRFKSNMDSGSFLGIQLAAVEALRQGPIWYERLNAKYTQRRILARQIMDTIGCTYKNEQAGLFVWSRCPKGIDGYSLSDRLLRAHGLFITPGGIFGPAGNDYLRISLCSSLEVLEESLDRLSSFKS
ncbi:MAG: aminotransferase class I/II-fold pyridoxal phosphate-dependent enzyme [Bacteroidota bacterium]